MILSNRENHDALNEGRLVLDPAPVPRMPEPGMDCPYQTSAVDLRLGNEISYFREDLPLNINLRRGGFAKLFGTSSESVALSEDQPFTHRPNKFVIGRTLERIVLPLDKEPCLAARFEGRSSYARCGLLVHFTAPTIHAGFAGTITLELINLGPHDIVLYPGSPICQLILEEVKGLPFPNDSQFHGQGRAGGRL